MATITDYVFDTEFLDAGDILSGISIGIVCVQDGRKFYAVNSDIPQHIVRKGWLGENVWPRLPLANGELNLAHPHVLTPPKMADALWAFFNETYGRDRRNRIHAWYAAFDMVVLARFAGGFLNLGQPIPQYVHDLRARMELVGLGRFDMPDDPKDAHHALADAEWGVEAGRKMGAW